MGGMVKAIHEFEETVAIVTGGGSGLGREVCINLATAGTRVIVADVAAAAAEETASAVKDRGGRAVAAIADVSIPRTSQELVARALDEFGRLDYLYNGAGVEIPGSVVDFEDADLTNVFGVNIFGPMYMCRSAIPAIRRSGGGAIVNVASAVALNARPSMATYVASKGAVVALTRSIALDFARVGIRANCICPTAHDTPMVRAHYARLPNTRAEIRKNLDTVPMARWGRLDEFAEAVAFLLSPRSGYISGHTLVLDGGQLAGRMAH